MNLRNPLADELLPATRLEAVAQKMSEGMPMSISARLDALNIGVSYGRTFSEALRNLANVLESDGGGSGDRGFHPVRAKLHTELDAWLDGRLANSDGQVLADFQERFTR